MIEQIKSENIITTAGLYELIDSFVGEDTIKDENGDWITVQEVNKFGLAKSIEKLIEQKLNEVAKESVEGLIKHVKQIVSEEQAKQCVREMSFITFDNSWLKLLEEVSKEYLSSLEKGKQNDEI